VRPVTAEVAGSSPVAPALYTAKILIGFRGFGEGLEVGDKGRVVA
jgi:hypothetical protein